MVYLPVSLNRESAPLLCPASTGDSEGAEIAHRHRKHPGLLRRSPSLTSQLNADKMSRNAPLVLGFRAVLYALAAGNTCILKGSELSPRCFWCIGSILTAAGLPKGVLNVIYHCSQDAPEVTSALIKHPFIKKINFTGSSATGSIIAAQAGRYLKPVLMELGGKASAIVLKDANLPLSAEKCVMGSFSSSGQVCLHSSLSLYRREIVWISHGVARSACPPSVFSFILPSPTNSEKL